jgi:hypothetical protein
MALTAEAYDTAAVQTRVAAARGAVALAEGAMPRPPYRCCGTAGARRGPLSVATGISGSSEASRIVNARLSICAAIVTQFVLRRNLGTRLRVSLTIARVRHATPGERPTSPQRPPRRDMLRSMETRMVVRTWHSSVDTQPRRRLARRGRRPARAMPRGRPRGGRAWSRPSDGAGRCSRRPRAAAGSARRACPLLGHPSCRRTDRRGSARRGRPWS